jgi:hypothetical protein
VPRGTKSKERVPENLPASVHGVPAPIVFFFHFPFASNFLFVDSSLGEGLFRRYRLLSLLDPLGSTGCPKIRGTTQ